MWNSNGKLWGIGFNCWLLRAISCFLHIYTEQGDMLIKNMKMDVLFIMA